MTLLESLNDDTVNIEEDDPSFNDLHQLFISSSFSNNDNDNDNDNDNNDNNTTITENTTNNNNLNYTEILQQMQNNIAIHHRNDFRLFIGYF